jgi:hypothetical protein
MSRLRATFHRFRRTALSPSPAGVRAGGPWVRAHPLDAAPPRPPLR